jgi:hypothetical protein
MARPCFRCKWGKNDDRPTMWLSNHDFGVDECHPVELRVGFNRIPAMAVYIRPRLGGPFSTGAFLPQKSVLAPPI